jgi:uncharacterized Zn-finger protein
MEVKGVPLYKNDIGVKKIKIGAKGFVCIGESPPMDHPHIYLTMPSDGHKICLYCNTEFVCDEALRYDKPEPNECYHGMLENLNNLSTTI